MKECNMFLVALALITFASIPAKATVMIGGGNEASKSYACRKPIEINEVRIKLKAGKNISSSDLKNWNQQSKSSIEILTFEHEARAYATIRFGKGDSTRRLEMDSATLPARASRILSEDATFDSSQLKPHERLLLKLSAKYQIFAPDLVEEITDNNIAEVYIQNRDLEIFRRSMSEEKFNKTFNEQLARYKQNPSFLMGWDQLETVLKEYPDFALLLNSSFIIFEGQLALIAVSANLRLLSVCVPSEEKNVKPKAVESELIRWINSPDVRNLMSCEGLLG